MVPVQFAAEASGIIWPLNQPDTALLREKVRLAYSNMRRCAFSLAPCLQLIFLDRTVIPTYDENGATADILPAQKIALVNL